MSTKVPHNQEDQEIDLVQISRKIGNFFDKINSSIFRSIQFFIRNWIIVLVLIISGFAIGWYLDSTTKTYSNQIIVEPNFESVDYLYSKIDLLQSKVISHDTIFLKNVVGIKKPKFIKKIQVRPIVEAYKLVDSKEKIQLLELMAENGDVNKILVDTTTSKNYRYHTVSFVTDDLGNDKDFVTPIMSFLNDSEYFNTVQKIELKNLEATIIQNDSIIKQINAFLSNFSSKTNGSLKNDKLVYYNENTQLNDLIKTKQGLIESQGRNRLRLISYEKTIKEISNTINVESKKSINSKQKFYLPILFILLFIFLNTFKLFYKKQQSLVENKKIK